MDLDSQQRTRPPAEGREMPELPDPEGSPPGDAEGDIPDEALEEARRWDDLPSVDPEESTGIDAG